MVELLIVILDIEEFTMLFQYLYYDFMGKKRNTVRHGGTFSTGKFIWEITKMIKKFIHNRYKVSLEGKISLQILLLGGEQTCLQFQNY